RARDRPRRLRHLVLLVVDRALRLAADPGEGDGPDAAPAGAGRSLGASEPELVVERQRLEHRRARLLICRFGELVEHAGGKDAVEWITPAHGLIAILRRSGRGSQYP